MAEQVEPVKVILQAAVVQLAVMAATAAVEAELSAVHLPMAQVEQAAAEHMEAITV